MNHHEHSSHQKTSAEIKSGSTINLAVQATLHCLAGCGIGEVIGMIISTALALSNFHSIVVSLVFGFVGGLLLGILPLKKNGFALKKALKIVIAAEGLSIAVMEAFQVLTELAIPGVMSAHLTDGIFWLGMFAALGVGFIAALPVNYIMIRRGVRHMH